MLPFVVVVVLYVWFDCCCCRGKELDYPPIVVEFVELTSELDREPLCTPDPATDPILVVAFLYGSVSELAF